MLGAAAGLLSAVAGVGVSLLVSVLLGDALTPITAVGDRFIDATPGSVKDWAVRTLGTNDKPVLLAGIFTVIGLLACVIGVVAWRSRTVALALAAALGLVAVAAALTDPSHLTGTASRLTPSIVALIVSVLMLSWFTKGWQHAPRDRQLPNSNALAAAQAADVADPDSSFGSSRFASSNAPRRRSTPQGGGTRTENPAPAGFDRRAFLAAALVSGAAVTIGAGSAQVFGGAGARSRESIRLPKPSDAAAPLAAGTSVDVTGVTPFLTSANSFYRVDTALAVPQIDASTWRLKIHGMVDHDIELSFQDLLRMPLVERRITLTCVSNEVGGDLIGNATWLGVKITDLLDQVSVNSAADAVRSTSVDGFTVGTPLAALTDGRDAMIAIGMNGQPLPLAHGFPARMVVPGLYGYVSATKWLVDMEITSFDQFSSYWTDRGWSAEAPIKTESRIDVPGSFAQLKAGRIPIAGVAWAQHTGIKKAEVRIEWRGLATGPAGRRGLDRHLASVGLCLGRKARQPHARSARDRRLRLHTDFPSGATSTKWGHWLAERECDSHLTTRLRTKVHPPLQDPISARKPS